MCHRNHIHISFTWDGASGRTSFWDGTPMDGPYCKPARSSASTRPAVAPPTWSPSARSACSARARRVGVPERCRLQQDRWSGDSHRMYAKVTGQGGIPATGVAAVAVQVTAMGSNAPANVRIWAPGQCKSEIVAKVADEQGRRRHGHRPGGVGRDHRPRHLGRRDGPLGRRRRLLPGW